MFHVSMIEKITFTFSLITLHVVLAAHLQTFRKLNVKSVLMAHSL